MSKYAECNTSLYCQIWGYANSYWELRCQRPKLKKLKKLLMENPYDGPLIGAQEESPELVKVQELSAWLLHAQTRIY